MSNCVSVVRHSQIKVEENKRKAIFLNDQRKPFKVGKIDGCLVSEGIRADYFVSDGSVSVLVELKGCNIDHACRQLFEAAENRDVKRELTNRLGFLVICSRVPSASTATQIAAQKARKKYKSRFVVYCNKRTIDMKEFEI